MKKFRIKCPHCSKSLVVYKDYAGKKAVCPGCEGWIKIPDEKHLDEIISAFNSNDNPKTSENPRSVILQEAERVFKNKELELKMKEFTKLEGFMGVGVIENTGEPVCLLTDNKIDMNEAARFIVDILHNVQNVTEKIGVKPCELLHIETDIANVLIRYLNPETITIDGQKNGLFLVLICKSDTSLGMVKIEIESFAKSL